MDEVLDKEGRLSLGGVVIEIHPGVVIPHGGCTGFSCMTKHKNIPPNLNNDIKQGQNKTNTQVFSYLNKIIQAIISLMLT